MNQRLDDFINIIITLLKIFLLNHIYACVLCVCVCGGGSVGHALYECISVGCVLHIEVNQIQWNNR